MRERVCMVKQRLMSGSPVVKHASIAIHYVVTGIVALLLVSLISALES